jgi:two-component system, cell cycle sensor histidine kinase and response regulator CckA
MMRRARTEDIQLDVRLAPDAGRIRLDAAQFEQVLVNLAINERNAMPGGGMLSVCTAVGEPTGGTSVRDEAPNAVLTVSDTGIGMDAVTSARIFEPFFTTKEVGRGTGLGLATMYVIVQRAGGQITVDSQPGVGTTFRIAFPMVTRTEPSATETTPLTRTTVLEAPNGRAGVVARAPSHRADSPADQ